MIKSRKIKLPAYLILLAAGEVDEWFCLIVKLSLRKKLIFSRNNFYLIMETEWAFRLFNRFKNDHFSLVYMGRFDDELTATIMRANEVSIQEPQMLKKRLSFLIAECFQNIIRHEDKPDIITRTNNKPKVLLVRNIGNKHYISSSNLISNTKKEDLISKLKTINTLSSEMLKSVYMDAFENNDMSDKGGAGLGLLEMARKTGSPLQYAFEFVNYFSSIFYFQICFESKREAEDTVPDNTKPVHIDETQEIYNLILSENIQMVRKGDFSQESILPLIELIEGNLKLKANSGGDKKKIIYMLVELLQNLSKHAPVVNGQREGIFTISIENNRYVLTTGNYININDVEPLKEKLKSIRDLDKNELMDIYKEALKKEPGPKGNAGIGLIELCKFSSEKIRFSFRSMDETMSFFSLSIIV
jgi:hypothetical protein